MDSIGPKNFLTVCILVMYQKTPFFFFMNLFINWCAAFLSRTVKAKIHGFSAENLIIETRSRCAAWVVLFLILWLSSFQWLCPFTSCTEVQCTNILKYGGNIHIFKTENCFSKIQETKLYKIVKALKVYAQNIAI